MRKPWCFTADLLLGQLYSCSVTICFINIWCSKSSVLIIIQSWEGVAGEYINIGIWFIRIVNSFCFGISLISVLTYITWTKEMLFPPFFPCSVHRLACLLTNNTTQGLVVSLAGGRIIAAQSRMKDIEQDRKWSFSHSSSFGLTKSTLKNNN